MALLFCDGTKTPYLISSKLLTSRSRESLHTCVLGPPWSGPAPSGAGRLSYSASSRKVQKRKCSQGDSDLDPWFVTGFSDGEGCFTCSITENKKLKVVPSPPWHPPPYLSFPLSEYLFSPFLCRGKGKRSTEERGKEVSGNGGGEGTSGNGQFQRGPPAGLKVKPGFKISQHVRDKTLLEDIKNSIGVGRISKERPQALQLVVQSMKELVLPPLPRVLVGFPK